MRRGPNRQDRPPRVGAAVLAKALVGVFLIFVCTGVGDGRCGLLPVPQDRSARPGADADADPRASRTRNCRRRSRAARARCSCSAPTAATSARPTPSSGRSRTRTRSCSIRLDPKRNRVAVLSLPRDLAVTIPGYADGAKINQAYDEGGAALTLKTVKHLFESATAEPMVINSVIDVNFNGFQRAVNYVKGVYVDVDRRYYNPEGTGLRGDRHRRRLSAPGGLRRARVRPLPAHGQRHLPQRAPAGLPAPGGQPEGGAGPPAAAAMRGIWCGSSASTSASTASS